MTDPNRYITDHDLKEYIKNGGINQFYIGWKEYKDSPYARYERLRKGNNDNSSRL